MPVKSVAGADAVRRGPCFNSPVTEQIRRKRLTGEGVVRTLLYVFYALAFYTVAVYLYSQYDF
jgi:hypothetical protein